MQTINTRAEAFILVYLMTFWSKVSGRLMPRLTESHFADPFHQRCFQAISDLRHDADNQALAAKVASAVGAREVGKLLTEYGFYRENAWHADYYFRELELANQRRRMLSVSEEIAEAASDQSNQTPFKALQAAYDELSGRRASMEPSLLGDSLESLVGRLESKPESRHVVWSGLRKVDEQCGGWRGGENIVLAAGPGIGKSAFALQAVAHNCRKGRSVLVVTLEMEAEILFYRLICAATGITLRCLSAGEISPRARTDATKAMAEIASWKLGVADSGKMTASDIESRAIAHQDAHGLDLLVVDYMGLIRPENAKASRYEQVTQISRDIKLMAVALKVPVLCLCQINREGFKNRRPTLANLRDSGAIEQDADMVVFIYPGPNEDKQHRIIEVAKNRRGETGIVETDFDGRCQTFTERVPLASECDNYDSSFEEFNNR